MRETVRINMRKKKGKELKVQVFYLPSNKSDAEPRQYSITSWNKNKQIFV